MARIRAVLRRAGRTPKEAEVLEAGGIKLVPSARQVTAEGASVAVTTVEYVPRVPGALSGPDRLSRRTLRRPCTGDGRPNSTVLSICVCSQPRRKLGRHGDVIRTVRGVGYLCSVEPDGPGDT